MSKRRQLGRGGLEGDAAKLRVLIGAAGTPAGAVDHGGLLGLGDDDHPQYLRADGARDLTGNLDVDAGVTIDGVDISAHAASSDAHHDPVTVGNTGLSLSGQEVSLNLAATSGLSISSGLLIDDAIAGAGLTIASKVLAVGVSGLGLSVAADAVTLASSSNPGAAASLLATDASGYVTLERLLLPNDTGFVLWRNAADTGTGGLLSYSGDNDLALHNATPGRGIYFTVFDSDGVATPNIQIKEYGTSDDIQIQSSSHFYITSFTEGITIEPSAGQSLNINLSTTGDLIVNTDDLVVDTSTGRVGVRTAVPLTPVHIVTGSGEGDPTDLSALGVGLTMQNNVTSAYASSIAVIAGSAGNAMILLGDKDDSDVGRILYSNSTNQMSFRANASSATLTIGGGVLIGNPTGGDKGAGTINAAADIYKNNSSFTNPDYALEMWRDGRISQFSDNPGASTYRRLSLTQIKSHIVDNLRLPGFSDEPAGIFERGDLVLEKLEEIFTHLIEHDERLEAIEQHG